MEEEAVEKCNEFKCDDKLTTENENIIRISSLSSQRDVMTSLLYIKSENLSEFGQNLTEIEQ